MGLFSRKKSLSTSRKTREIDERVVISFGSGYCRVAYIDEDSKVAHPIHLDGNKEAMIMLIAFYNHEVFYGSRALKQYTSNARNTVPSPHWFIGRTLSEVETKLQEYLLPVHEKNGELLFEFTKMPPRLVDINGKLVSESVPKTKDLQRSVIQLVSLILERLKSIVEHNLQGKLRRATLVLSPNIDVRQQNAYRAAAALAGIEVYITFDAVSFMTRQYLNNSRTAISPPKQSHLALYIDLSENCSDITLLKISHNNVIQVQTLHEDIFRGDEFTHLLQGNVLRLAFENWKIKSVHQPFENLLELYFILEEHKKRLTSFQNADISINSKIFGKEFRTTVTRQQYDLYCAPLLKYFETLLENFFTLTSYNKNQVGDIFFVGNGAQYSLASDIIRKIFNGATVHHSSNLFVQIAEGASQTNKFSVSTSMNCIDNPFTDIIETYYSHQLIEMEWTDDSKIAMSLRETSEEKDNQTSHYSTTKDQSAQRQRGTATLAPTESGSTQLELNPIPVKTEKGNMQLEPSPEPRVKGNSRAELTRTPLIKGNARAEPTPRPDKLETTSPPLQGNKGMLLARKPIKDVPDIGKLNISTPSAMRRTKAVGISLGNYNGVVTVQRQAIVNKEGSIVMPCFVTFDDNGPIVGTYAKHSLASRPSNTLPLCDIMSLAGYPFDSAKVRAAIKSSPYALVEKDGQVAVQVEINDELEIFSLDDIVTLVLKELAKLAVSQEAPSHTVFAVPNDWDQKQERVLLSQSFWLGLGQVSFISDKTAIVAAMNHLIPQSAEGSNCLVLDIGARALNVLLLRKTDGQMQAVGTKSSGDLGGSQVDELLMQHFLSIFNQQHNKEIPVDVFPRLRLHCETIKKRVSAAGPDDTISTTIYSVVDYTDIELSMTHSLLKEICKGLFDGVVQIVAQLLVQAKLEKKQIDDLVIIGGGASIPGMKNALQSFFEGKQAATLLARPEEYISYGAAVYAECLE